MSEDIKGAGGIDGQDASAVSIFGQGAGLNDFPVLKAFQQYIDAEQAKARKRMLGLSVFFICLLLVVVVTFTLVVLSIINRNQALSDRLLDIALRQPSQPQPVVNVQPSAPQPIIQPVSQDNSLKPILEKIETFMTALTSRQQQQLAPAPVVVTTAAPAPVAIPQQDSAEISRMRDELKKQKQDLEAERARLKETQEKLKQAEIEKHRRRLYPEYYAQEDARKGLAAPRPAAQPQSKLAGIKPIDYFNQDDDDLDEIVKQRKKAVKTPAQPKQAPVAKPAAPSKPAPTAKPATATNTKPAPAAKQKPSPSRKPAIGAGTPKPALKTETLEVGGSDGETIPWLIEQKNQ